MKFKALEFEEVLLEFGKIRRGTFWYRSNILPYIYYLHLA